MLAIAAPQSAGALRPFRHDGRHDVSGVYLPANPVRIGKWQLADIRMDTLEQFAAYEANPHPTAADAPVELMFDDMTSPEMRIEGHATRARTHQGVPSSYDVEGGRVNFAGSDDVLGAFQFKGYLAFSALGRARKTNGSDETVLSGTLTVGGKTFANLGFTWSGFGD